MPQHDIIVVGASAGGVEALSQLVTGLPSDLPAAIFIVIHVPAWGKSVLPDILSRKGSLPATHATDAEVIVQGHIYVAPPNHHLLVKRGYIRLAQGPKENGCRPAIDPLFRTAAKAYGQQVIGVVLSGSLDDGTAGLMEVKRAGGLAVVQHPDDALFSSMPSSAIEHVEVDHILPVSSIGPVLARLANERVVAEGAKTVFSESEMEIEPDIVELDGAALRSLGKPGEHANLSCPDCGGSLYLATETALLQYRCRVGHAFSVGSLLSGQAQAQEEALWAAIRSLEERAELMNQMANNARTRNRPLSAKRFEEQAREACQRADLIRQALFQSQLPATAKADTPNPVSSGSQGQELAAFNVVVLAAEAGGLKVLSQILSVLPQNFPAAVIVVQHLDTESSSSWMADVFSRPTTLPIQYAQEGEGLQPGRVYIAPLNKHLLVNRNGTFSLSEVAFVDFAPPSADLLLQSVAASFKERAIAVILTGTGSNGTLGVQAIHKMGGKVIAQDEITCEFFEMPNAAIQTGKVDLILPPNAIASTLVKLVTTEAVA